MMNEFEMSGPIATRRLQFRRTDGTVADVIVTVGKPVPDPRDPKRTWMCPLQIMGVGDEKVRPIFGADAMQALILGLHILPTILESLARSGHGSFVGDCRSDLGLTHACETQLGKKS